MGRGEMNSILDKLEQNQTGMRKGNGFRRSPILDYKLEPTGNMLPGGFQPMEGYLLTVTLGISFWSNKVMFEDSKRDAERMLLTRLYGETLALLDEASHAIYNGEPEDALQAINAIKDALTKPRRTR
ncbi:hypothetical protein CIG66_07185 [Ralstonia pseudosolanacearum]|nr:hypothetical protein CIG66_07185 [Ralstonia pseudosolanacearum]